MRHPVRRCGCVTLHEECRQGGSHYRAHVILQGVFRGLGDTKIPLVATIGVNVVNVALCPLLIFSAGLGIRGAAMATVTAEVPSPSLIYRPSTLK
jgi:peptidoglycan biosynthesis protein MviN/MurJ (putative lipid II flippase)